MQYAVGRSQFDTQHPTSGQSLPAAYRRCRTGFSLTELLVVIAIIVLALALAVPALNLLTGAKSTEQANNLIGVMLAQVRNEAIGLQKYRGVMFYRDPAGGRIKMVMVQESDPDAFYRLPDIDVYLDLVEGVDALTLPTGVMIQTVDDAGGTGISPSPRPNDRYIGFNTIAHNIPAIPPKGPVAINYGGVILFDGHGQLANKSYALQTHRTDPNASPATPPVQMYTPMGVLMYSSPDIAHLVRVEGQLYVGSTPSGQSVDLTEDIIPCYPPPNTAQILKSQVGFVLFNEENFKNNGGTDDDLQIVKPGNPYAGSTEETEEAWIDNNSVPALINRYNGSLVKGE